MLEESTVHRLQESTQAETDAKSFPGKNAFAAGFEEVGLQGLRASSVARAARSELRH